MMERFAVQNIGDPNNIPIKVLGQGSFGTVFLCQRVTPINNSNLQNTTTFKPSYVCVKQILFKTKNELKSIKDEIYIISQLHHPRIIQFYDYYVYKNSLNIVMEYAAKGTLRNLLNKQAGIRYFNNSEIRNLFCDILMGIENLHIRGVVHCDLKPDNILIGSDGRIKIADFGISILRNDKSTQFSPGTPLYNAPEIINGCKNDIRSDIWSLGMIFIEICTFKHPFQNIKTKDALKNVMAKQNFATLSGFSAPIKRIGSGMLTLNPSKRLTISSIVIDPWIAIHYYNLYFNYK